MTSVSGEGTKGASAPEDTGSGASRRQFLGLAVALATAGVAVGGAKPALATPPSGEVTRTDLAVGRFDDGFTMATNGPSDFHIAHVVLEPGADSGWHTHPGAALDIVTSGALTWYFGGSDCDPARVEAGHAMFVPAGVAHIGRNEGSEPAEVYVTYLVAAGAAPRNDAAEPDNCTG